MQEDRVNVDALDLEALSRELNQNLVLKDEQGRALLQVAQLATVYLPDPFRREVKEAMMMQRFWVIGGEYRDCDFRQLCEDCRAFGPFGSYGEAEEVWRERSTESRPVALMRYSIVTNARPAQHAVA